MPLPRDPRLDELACQQHGIVTLHQLRTLGVTRGHQRAQIESQRWAPLAHRGVEVRASVDDQSAWWRALALVGRPAALGGISALQAAGLTGYDEPQVHVWLPKSARVVRPEGVRVHETRRWTQEDWVGTGLPRARPSIATVQAALWAVSRRQAVLALVMPVQQRLVRPQDVAEVLDRVRRHRYRTVLRSALADISNGAHSMNELDFAALCREYGLPEPSRQVVRRGAGGRIYLDVRWDAYRVTLEINGAGHARLDHVMDDDFRTIDLQLEGELAIEVWVLTLRASPDQVMALVAAALRSRGWRGEPRFRPAPR